MTLLLVALRFLLTSALLQSLECDPAPDGWAAMKYLLQRSDVYAGMSFEVSSDLTFYGRPAAYLRTLYYGGVVGNNVTIAGKNVAALAALNVYEADPNNYRTALIKRMQIDFTSFRDLAKGGVQVKLKELGLATEVLNRADTPQDLFGGTSIGGAAIVAPSPNTTELHSQLLRLGYEASNKADKELSPGSMYGTEDDNLSHEQLLYFGFDTQTLNDLGLEPVFGGFTAAPDNGSDGAVPIYTAKENGPFTIQLKIDAHIEAHATKQVGIIFYQQFKRVEAKFHLRVSGSINETLVLAPPVDTSGNGGTLGLNGDYVADLHIPATTKTWNLQAGDKLYLYADYFIHEFLPPVQPQMYQATITATVRADSFFRITADSTTPATLCRGIYVHEALRRLCEGMADQPNCLYSDYYGRTDSLPAYAVDGPGSQRLLTNGFGLRGYPLPQDAYTVAADGIDPRKALTASFADVFSGLHAIDCLGAGFEMRQGRPTVRIEPRAYFYQPGDVLQLGQVTDLVTAPNLPGYFNEVHVGYQRWQSSAQVGLDEFNGQRLYSTGLSAVKATYSVLSTLSAAGYLIEATRRQRYTSATNQEGQADQQLFVISLRRQPGGLLVTEKAEAFSSVTGILDPGGQTTYNLRLSPARNLRRHAPFFKAGLSALTTLTLTKSEGNDKLVSQLRTEVNQVVEQESPALTELPAPVYLAETYEFTARLRRHQVRRLTANPYGQVSFLDGATKRRGYVLKVEIEPETGLSTFTLLRTNG